MYFTNFAGEMITSQNAETRNAETRNAEKMVPEFRMACYLNAEFKWIICTAMPNGYCSMYLNAENGQLIVTQPSHANMVWLIIVSD